MPQHTNATDRRRFLQVLGLAGIAGAMPASGLLAQSSTPPRSPARADSAATPPPPATPTGPSDDARALAEILKRRYGQHLNDEQLLAVTRELDQRIQGGRRLREAKLVNADEPDTTFRA
jgi:hypothetical protein